MRSIRVDETKDWEVIKCHIDSFPDEQDEVLPGVKWGSFAQLYTPAFWKIQYLLSDFSNGPKDHRLAPNLIEEVVMCLLGGYGIPSEVGLLAFDTLKANDCVKTGVSYQTIYNVLSKPMQAGNGKQIHYRFYSQKSRYIFNFLNRSDLDVIPQTSDLELRAWLLTVDGIGMKTASWVTRNWLQSDNVAIIDIHLLRAGKLTGFFSSTPRSNYLQLEKEYLAFCTALNVLASNMDALIWGYMKKNTKLANTLVNE